MKMNVKVFRSLTTDPLEVQDINGEELAIYPMEATPYHQQFLSRGRLSAWTSDGKTFKLLVDKGFFEASGNFFDSHVNGIWVNLLREAGKINGKLMKVIMLPAFLLLLVISILGFVFFEEHSQTIMLVSVIVLFIVQMVQSRKVNKKFEELQVEAQNKIFEYLGEEQVQEIVKRQEEYMQKYYKIEDEQEATDDSIVDAEFSELEEVNQIENNEELESDESNNSDSEEI